VCEQLETKTKLSVETNCNRGGQRKFHQVFRFAASLLCRQIRQVQETAANEESDKFTVRSDCFTASNKTRLRNNKPEYTAHELSATN